MSMQRDLSSGLIHRFRGCHLSPGPHPLDRNSCPLTGIVLFIIRVFAYSKFGCREKRPMSS